MKLILNIEFTEFKQLDDLGASIVEAQDKESDANFRSSRATALSNFASRFISF